MNRFQRNKSKSHFGCLIPGIKNRSLPICDSDEDPESCVVDPETTADNVPSFKLRMSEEMEDRAKRPGHKLRLQLIKNDPHPGWIKREHQGAPEKRQKLPDPPAMDDRNIAKLRGVEEIVKLLLTESPIPRLQQSQIMSDVRAGKFKTGRQLATSIVTQYLDDGMVRVGTPTIRSQMKPVVDLIVLAFDNNINGKVKKGQSKDRFFEVKRFEAARKYVIAAQKLLDTLVRMARTDIFLPEGSNRNY